MLDTFSSARPHLSRPQNTVLLSIPHLLISIHGLRLLRGLLQPMTRQLHCHPVHLCRVHPWLDFSRAVCILWEQGRFPCYRVTAATVPCSLDS
jgi:hypothetical protein